MPTNLASYRLHYFVFIDPLLKSG